MGALILLPIGGVMVPFLGWVAGVALLWLSSRWKLRDKLIGTLVLPGGLLPAVAIALMAAPIISPPFGAIVAVALVVAPIGTSIHLATRLRHRDPAGERVIAGVI